ncbi:hypothetical protein [Wolbachia endosymbiont of Pentidionis agamae]|uniref:hypothetical protein n=1 Tax=Wolbachia endosymbiont of Pentidionis agamae TaxID=3110435 RepID=UPI002FD782F5
MLLLLGIIFYVIYSSTNFADRKVLYSWSQVLPGDMLGVRAIVKGNSKCPYAYINDKKIEMAERGLPSGQSFPEKVC